MIPRNSAWDVEDSTVRVRVAGGDVRGQVALVGPGDAFEKRHEAEEEVLGEGVQGECFAEECRQKISGMPARGYGVLEVVDVRVAIDFGEMSHVAGEGGFADESENSVCFGGVFGVGGDGRVELFDDGV